jgi:hypothetical protein
MRCGADPSRIPTASPAHNACRIREEAALAAIAFNTVHRADHARGRLRPVLAALHETLDRFVSYRMRLAAAEAEHVCPRRVRRDVIEQRAAITMQLKCPDLSQRKPPTDSTAAIARNSPRSGILPVDEPATTTVRFPPLDPDIVSEAIPAFFIGRNEDGFWVARDAQGKTGGLFLFEISALSFARRSSPPRGCATIFPSHRFELDLENRGNPLVAQLARLKRLAMFARQRMAALRERFLR